MSYHSLFLLNDGTVKSCGRNNYGQLGLGNTTKRPTPTLIPDLENVKGITVGDYFSLFLLNDGTVKACGYNNYGQLGLGNTNNALNLTLIPDLNNVAFITANASHTLFLLNDGTVKSCGQNDYGQCGLGDTNNNKHYPTLIPGLNNVKQISCSRDNSLFLLNDGTVKACGNNNNNRLGIPGTITNITTPTLIPDLENVKQISAGFYGNILFLMNDGTVKGCGNNSCHELGIESSSQYVSTPTLIPDLDNVKQISAGSDFTLFLLNDGNVKGCGNNTSGAMGKTLSLAGVINSVSFLDISEVKYISAYTQHTNFLMNDGTIKTCGYNNYGQLGLSSGSSNITTVTTIPNLNNVNKLINQLDIMSSYYYFEYNNKTVIFDDNGSEILLSDTVLHSSDLIKKSCYNSLNKLYNDILNHNIENYRINRLSIIE